MTTRDENLTAFDAIMGNCCGVDMLALTPEDIRTQSDVWASSGERPQGDEREKQIAAAVRGLEIYQDEIRERNRELDE